MPKRGLIKVEDWDSVVSAIYDSAINPNRWTDVIEAVGRLTHAPSGVLHCVEHQPQTTRAGSVLLEYNTDPYWSVQYKQHYASLNPAAAKVPYFPLFKPLTFRELFDWSDFTRSEFHNEYRIPQNFGDSMSLLIDRSARRTVSFTLFRPTADPIFTPSDTRIMARLASHVQRSIEIGGMLAEFQPQSERLKEVFNLLQLGVVVLDRERRVLHCNPAADEMRAEQLFAVSRDGGFNFTHMDDTHWIARAINGELGHNAKRSLKFGLDQSVVATAVLIDKSNGSADLFREIRSAACILVLTRNTDNHRNIIEIFGEAHRLSPTEGKVLQLLLEGATLSHIAGVLAIKPSTVKTHMHRIFAKTETTRQADLVRKAGAFRSLVR